MALFFVGSRSLLHRPGAPPSTSIPICRLPTPRPQPTGDKNSRIQPKPIIFCCCYYHRPSIFIHHRSSVFRFHFQRQRQNLINQTFSHWASSISLTSPIITQPREPSSTKAITSSTSGQSLSLLLKASGPIAWASQAASVVQPLNHWAIISAGKCGRGAAAAVEAIRAEQKLAIWKFNFDASRAQNLTQFAIAQ